MFCMPTARVISVFALSAWLSTSSVLYAAQAETTKTPDATQAANSTASPEHANVPDESESPFLRQRSAIIDAAQDRDWNTATVEARKLLDMAIPRGNPYEQMDAADLLVRVLHEQARYAEALKVIDEVLELTRQYASGPIAGQMEDLIHRAMLEAIMSSDPAALSRYQEVLQAYCALDPSLWQWDLPNQRLIYSAAQVSLPLHIGRWVLTNIEQADDRHHVASIRYLYVTETGKAIPVSIDLSYDARLRTMTPQTKQEDLTGEEQRLSDDQQPDPELGQQFPDLDYADTVQIKYATREKRGQLPDVLHMHWLAMRDNWRLRISADFVNADAATAQVQIPLLRQAIAWPKAVELPGDDGLDERLQTIDAAWRLADDWQHAGALAKAELPHAVFPRETARLQSVIGIAAFKAGQFDQAQQALIAARDAWPYVRQTDYDATLYEHTLEYASDIAARAGREGEAIELIHQYVKSTGNAYFEWNLQDTRLVHKRTGRVIPLRAAGFHVRPLDDKRFYYQDVTTGQTVGLTTGLAIPASDGEQERLLRNALAKQFRLDVWALHKTNFQSAFFDGVKNQQSGMKWVFDVSPQKNDTNTLYLGVPPTGPAVAHVVLWIVDNAGERSILRASVTDDEQETRATALANALPW